MKRKQASLVQFSSIWRRLWIQRFAVLMVQPKSILWSNTWSLLLRPIKRATHNNNKLPSGSALWLSQGNLMFIQRCFVSCAVACSVFFLHSPPLPVSSCPSEPEAVTCPAVAAGTLQIPHLSLYLFRFFYCSFIFKKKRTKKTPLTVRMMLTANLKFEASHQRKLQFFVNTCLSLWPV